jgi:copper chaperone CopZ
MKGKAMITSYTISGMTCNHCAHAISGEVGAVPGVTDATVSLETGKLDVTSEAPVDFDRIVEAVYEAGEQYSVA